MSAARPDASPIPTIDGMYQISQGSRCVAVGVLRDGKWAVSGWATVHSAQFDYAFGNCTFARLEPVPDPAIDPDPARQKVVAELEDHARACMHTAHNRVPPRAYEERHRATGQAKLDAVAILHACGYLGPVSELLKNIEGLDSEPHV